MTATNRLSFRPAKAETLDCLLEAEATAWDSIAAAGGATRATDADWEVFRASKVVAQASYRASRIATIKACRYANA